jgi:hypothetical protein
LSKIEVNAIEPQCGTNLTVGASGDTITFPSGTTVVNNGSQTGFGRTGTVDWDTTAKTASFTAVSGNGYFVNTTSGAVTMTLPASPSAGDIVSVKDYAYTFATNNLTVAPNGSNIGGGGGQNVVYSTNGTSKTFIYVDGTQGWLVTNESTDTSSGEIPTYITATGGTITTDGDYKVHSFTGPGTFTVCSVGNAAGSNSVDYLVVAGGGGGGAWVAGGAGAGGYRFSDGTASGCYTAGPAPLGASALPISAQSYPITVGSGGTGSTAYPGGPGPSTDGGNGNNSVFSTITSTAGGGGGGYCAPASPGSQSRDGLNGGSGGGAGAASSPDTASAGAGNTPPVSPPQGNNGGANTGSNFSGAGGGGSGAVGTSVGSSGSIGGAGGNGLTSCITASPVARGGGGGGGSQTPGNASPGGTGGGGNGAGNCGPAAGAGSANTGGGGGGGRDSNGGNGGSGIVIIRYKFQ